MNSVKRKIAVIGGGSWATALVKILSENDNVHIFWWLRKPKEVDHILKYGNNPSYLSDVSINLQKVFPSPDVHKVVAEAEIIVLAVPAAFIKDVLAEFKGEIRGRIIVSAIKGMVPQYNCLVSDLLEKNHGLDPQDFCMIAGPCHSEEVAMEKQSYLTIAGSEKGTAELVAGLLNCRYIKTSTLSDAKGAEYAAVMKNIYGIACGMARGLNYGDNFQAVLVANAMQEMEYFLENIFTLERNVNFSAYLGDLLVTAYSQFSRNRTLGNMVGRGYSVKAALVEMNMIAEGYYAVNSLQTVATEHQIDLPIVKAVYNVLYEKISPSIEFKILEGLLT